MSAIGHQELVQPVLASTDWQAMVRAGYILVAVVVFGMGSWAALARIDGAVVAAGVIAVESNRKTIQHFEGGIVSDILVRDGDKVKEGAPLVRLDPTRNEATRDLYQRQLASALALEARLIAQRDFADTISFPVEVEQRRTDPVVASTISDNKNQFDSKRESLQKALSVIDTQSRQAEQEINQSNAARQIAISQLATIARELPGLRILLEKGLTALTRVTTLERQQLDLQGVVARAEFEQIKGREKLAELTAKGEQARQDYRQEASNLIPDVKKQISDLRQQIIIAEDTLHRVDIVAPVSGTVQQLRIFTRGGVIRPGDPILDIVPLSAIMVVKAKIAPVDVDRVRVDKPVEIRMPQFQRFQSEVIRGTVKSVSQDTIMDEVSRLSYYAMEIVVDRSTIPVEIADRLSAGMTTDVIIPTGERTVLQYLVAPITDSLSKTFRER
jgi:membrane fusion protein, S-layer protein transport system